MSYSDQAAFRSAKFNREIAQVHGDLLAIRVLRSRMILPLDHWAEPTKGIAAKKKLWTAHSRMISQVAKRIGVDDPNSTEGKLVRELIGLASKGI